MPLNSDALLNDDTFLYVGRRILAGKCCLFLGAGASLSSGAPTSSELATLISSKVLMTDEEFSLADAAAYADALAGRRAVVDVIVDRFKTLVPSPSLSGLVAFPWLSIFTTNFDDLIEKAYTQPPSTPAAQLTVYDPARGFDHHTPGAVSLYMVHGSIKRPLDRELGLVLTSDDMLHTSPQRRAILRRLLDDLHDSEVVYIGFSLSDIDFQQILAELWDAADNQSNIIPRGYALQPGFKSFAQRRRDSKKITLIDTTLESFEEALDKLASGKAAAQPIEIGSQPSLPTYLASIPLTSPLAEELERAFDFPQLNRDTASPAEFFHGGPATWGTIRDGVDAPRDVHDDLMAAALVDASDEPVVQSPAATHLLLVDGPAGTGKTTLLMRLAWDLAETWNRPVAWLKHPAQLQLDLIEALAQYARQRVYLFVDNCADAGLQLVHIINRCRRRGLKLTFIVGDRQNEWDASTRSNPLEPDRRYSLGRISKVSAR